MIAEQLKQLTDPNVAIRTRAAEELGDLLEYGKWPETDVAQTADLLIDAACQEQDAQARESQLNSLAVLSSKHIGVKASWQRLAVSLSAFDNSSLENALSALGFSRDLKFKAVLQGYLNHIDPAIRLAATHALRELTYDGSVRSS
jgi:hypothetical protein